MQILFVRHGQSQGNRDLTMQGQLDFPLTELGRDQARRTHAWLRQHALGWDAAWVSPLSRANETADILCVDGPRPQVVADLKEIHAGSLEGLNREQIEARHPGYFLGAPTRKGDFGGYAGESYAVVQARVDRVVAALSELYQSRTERVLLVGHGGFGLQLIKALICSDVPRLCNMAIGNCSVTKLRWLKNPQPAPCELSWHVPNELMG